MTRRRDNKICFWVSFDERAEILKRARRFGLTLSSYIRMKVLPKGVLEHLEDAFTPQDKGEKK